jgi:hypothetical protein
MQRLALTLSLVLSMAGTFACSSEGDDDGGEETGGSGGSATGGSSGSATGGSATGGSSGSSTGGSTTGGSSGSSTGGAATGGAGATGGSATGGSGGAAFTKHGSCGHKSATTTVTATSYADTTEDYYIISEESLAEGVIDEYICQIRVNVTRVGEAPPNCVDLEGVPCEWTHKVAISDPEVLMNVDGACDKSEAGWNAAWVAALDGQQSSYGYIDMYEGHDSVVMTATGAPGSETWSVLGRGSWDRDSGDFSFDGRGPCRY